MTFNLSHKGRVWMDEEPGEECGPWVGDVGDPEEPRGCSQASMGDP